MAMHRVLTCVTDHWLYDQERSAAIQKHEQEKRAESKNIGARNDKSRISPVMSVSCRGVDQVHAGMTVYGRWGYRVTRGTLFTGRPTMEGEAVLAPIECICRTPQRVFSESVDRPGNYTMAKSYVM